MVYVSTILYVIMSIIILAVILSAYLSHVEYAKTQYQKQLMAKESCEIQSFYELNFDICYKVGVKP